MNAPQILGNFPKWTPGDGPAPFVYSNRPPGQRCAWSCYWRTASPQSEQGRLVTPADWGYADPMKMTDAQICAELEDYLYGTIWAGFQGLTRAGYAVLLSVELSQGSRELVQNDIAHIRQTYPAQRNYINPFDPPTGKRFFIHKRPGWDVP